MTSRSRRLIATAAAGLAVFLAVLVLLGTQMARGHDPALGASVTTKQAPVTTAGATASTDEDSSSATSDDGSSDDATAASSPSTGTSSQSSSAAQSTPLQTSTS